MLARAAVVRALASRVVASIPAARRPSDRLAPLAAGSSDASDDSNGTPQKAPSFFDQARYTAPEKFNRWLAVPPLALAQGAMGGIYSWSVFNAPLTKTIGVVAPAAADWELTAVVPIFSAAAAGLGIATWFLGGWADRAGPRKVIATSGALWVGAFGLSGLGVATHTLPLVYLGYGILGGAGWGLGYLAPVHTMLKWFPKRRGLATGVALTTFGGGAMVATPVNEYLIKTAFVPPKFLGSLSELLPSLVSVDGVRMIQSAGTLREIVVATARDVAALPGVQEGVYLAGTGSSGTAETFFALAALYGAIMGMGALFARVPHPKWISPDAGRKIAVIPGAAAATGGEVASLTPAEALRTPQFYLIWLSLVGNAVGAVSVMACAKTMMLECFGTALPTVVTSAFAGSYIAALSAGNMVGRLSWATISDYIGPQRVYLLFGLSAPIAYAIPNLTASMAASPSVSTLAAFYGGTMLMISFYGGLLAVLPAHLADVYGPKHVGAMHGRMLTAWSAAAIAGPTVLTQLRAHSYSAAATELAAKTSPDAFTKAFGAPLTQLDELLKTKAVTIARLMELVPAGTQDPTPMLYDSTLYVMAACMTGAFVCNLMVRPLAKAVLPAASSPSSLDQQSDQQK